MCKNHQVPESLFADLDQGDFDREIAQDRLPGGHNAQPGDIHPDDYLKDQKFSTIKGAMFTSQCKACKGGGTFYSYAGRPVGPCFKCKGTGVIQTKTDPKVLAKQKEKALLKRACDALNIKDDAEKFLADNPDIAEWFTANASWMDFARSLQQQLNQKGSLSPKQIAAAQKSAAKMAVKKAEKEAVETSGLDISSLNGYYAVPQGDTRLKVRVNHPGKNSSWHGTIFVSDGAEYGQRQNYGRQGPGKLYSGKIQEELTAILANPLEAQLAYGKLTSTCGMCGRPLEDETSVEVGMGPICRGKAGI